MLGQVLNLDSIEVTQTAVQGDKGKVDTLNLHTLHQLTTEVQASGRCSNSTLVLSVDGLEISHILLGSRTTVDNVAWQWSLAQTEQHLLEFIVWTVVEETQRTATAGGVINHLSHHRTIFLEKEFVADTNLTGRLYKHIPQALVGIKLAQQEHLNLGIGLLLGTVQTGREHLSVVEDECIVLVKVVEDVTEVETTLDSLTLTMQHHQLALVAMERWLKCNLFFR